MNLRLNTRELIEALMGSRGRTRILETLAEEGGLNISQLSRRVRMNHTCVDSHIEKLKDLGLVDEKWYGKVRMIYPAFDEFSIRFKTGAGTEFSIERRGKG